MTVVRHLEDLDRRELAVVVRELLLAGQLMDRAGMPHVIGAYGREVMGEVAIDEWMGASPIYTRRTQRLLGFTGDDVETLFKGLQLDIGAPPEFMDFRLRVIDAHHGEFWLDHCGALMDVEPMGEEFVRTMCHTIEDPTFDATALATNPRARIRPVHRPPRAPADRDPHCHWTATIDPDLPALPEPEPATHLATTALAGLPIPTVDPDDDGWSDYRAPLDPDLRLEVFSRSALVGLAHEVAVQSQLLAMSFVFAVERRGGSDDARSIGRRQLSGIAGLTAERLRDALGLDSSLAALAQVLELHPLFRPRPWVDADVVLDEQRDAVEIRLRPCPAVDEERCTWVQLLVEGHDEGVDVLARGVDPRYRAERVAPSEGSLATWRIRLGDEPAPESRDVALTRFSTGAAFRFSVTPVELAGRRD
jgi:hypothetical protein